MFSSIRRARILIPFFTQRLSDYAELARLDLVTFRDDLIRSIVGAAVCAYAVLFLLCFICLAVLVTEWDTPNRIRVAWIICTGWSMVSIGAALLARSLMKGTVPFDNIGSEIARDLSVIKDPQGYTHVAPSSPAGSSHAV
jgi:amino acid transporter